MMPPRKKNHKVAMNKIIAKEKPQLALAAVAHCIAATISPSGTVTIICMAVRMIGTYPNRKSRGAKKRSMYAPVFQ